MKEGCSKFAGAVQEIEKSLDQHSPIGRATYYVSSGADFAGMCGAGPSSM
jgi:hypothetical protein